MGLKVFTSKMCLSVKYFLDLWFDHLVCLENRHLTHVPVKFDKSNLNMHLKVYLICSNAKRTMLSSFIPVLHHSVQCNGPAFPHFTTACTMLFAH